MRIAQLQEERQIKQLALSEFNAMCSHERLDNSSMQTLLKYFHHTGVFFYKDGLFNNQIVIDQKWAIDAVYMLFERTGRFFDKFNNKGLFTGEDLQKVWKQYTIVEQELFTDFMQKCEVCFELVTDRYWKKKFAERRFIAPQLLPEERPLSARIILRHGNGIYYKYRHRFLHAAVIQRFIVRTGLMALENNMWQHGIVLETSEGTALIEAFPQQNEIIIRLDDIDQKSLLNKIIHEMKEINCDMDDIEERVSLDGINYINIEHIRNNPLSNESIKTENGVWVKACQFNLFLAPYENVKFGRSDTMVFSKEYDMVFKSKKKRKRIPQREKIRAELQKEVNNECPFCNCTEVGHFEVHHIDEDPGNNEIANLILVCPTCHSKINKKDIPMEIVQKKKLFLLHAQNS
jgi:hypothetical protein